MSESDGWVYYAIGYSDYKMKIDGTEPTLIKGIHNCSFQISGDWIYYINADGYGINKIKKDGSDKTKIDDSPIFSFTILGDSISYSKGISQEETDTLLFAKMTDEERDKLESKLALYSIKTDGTGKTKLIDNAVRPIAIGDWVYFNDAAGDLFRIKGDGTEYSIIAEDAGVDSVYVSGEWLYYCSVTPEKTNVNKVALCRMKPDGTKQSGIIIVSGITGFCFDDGWFYYTSGKGLDRIKLDGTEKEKLNDINKMGLLGVTGDWMYIRSSNNVGGEATYRVKLDGSVGVQLKEVEK